MTTIDNASTMFSNLMAANKESENKTKTNYEKNNDVISSGSQELGKDQFMQLLATQLKHQDPSSPMDNTDFIAQLATFSSLEQMQNMSEGISDLTGLLELYMGFQINHNSSVGIAQSADLIGKKVTATIREESAEGEENEDGQAQEIEVEGIVSSIKVKNAVMYAVVNGQDVPLDQITTIE